MEAVLVHLCFGGGEKQCFTLEGGLKRREIDVYTTLTRSAWTYSNITNTYSHTTKGGQKAHSTQRTDYSHSLLDLSLQVAIK